jgi:hypothetical protein
MEKTNNQITIGSIVKGGYVVVEIETKVKKFFKEEYSTTRLFVEKEGSKRIVDYSSGKVGNFVTVKNHFSSGGHFATW